MNISNVAVVYLAGGMHTGWQDIVKDRLPGLIYLDPRDCRVKDEASYTSWDLAAVDRADIIFGYQESLNPGGSGMALELGWAAKAGKHIILAEEPGYPQERYFGMVRQIADAYFGPAGRRLPGEFAGLEYRSSPPAFCLETEPFKQALAYLAWKAAVRGAAV